MTPNQIKGRLIMADYRLVDIADECEVSEQSVGQIIRGLSTSDRIQRVIADKIGLPVEEVFPERYQPRKVSPRRKLQRQKMAR